MISKPVKKFACWGIVISILISGIPIAIYIARPHIFKQRLESIRTEQLALQARRKPSDAKPINHDDSNLPKNIKLKVPFTPQAPTANWDELHNESCEEASLIMANAYFNGITELSPEYVEAEINKLVKWEDENYNYHLSIDTSETFQLAESVYGLNANIFPISEALIKKSLADNKLVLLPSNGQLLKNPNFKQPGPIYHMLVITGYNEKEFITNDPGTKKGHDYVYDYKTLYNASGSWEHRQNAVNLHDKNIIVISK